MAKRYQSNQIEYVFNLINKEGHLPRWEQANILEKGIPKNIRRALEAVHIQSKDTTNTRSAFYTLAQPTYNNGGGSPDHPLSILNFGDAFPLVGGGIHPTTHFQIPCLTLPCTGRPYSAFGFSSFLL